MHEIYLIRHGQAGLRSDYDRLSDLGQEQARLLAEWFAAQDIRFDLILSGGLRRQQETAAFLSPAAQVDPQWNEFDLDAVYAAIAPRLAALDDEFKAEYETLQLEAADPAHAVHRAWRPSDLKVVKAWISSRFPVECESWPQFHSRILDAFQGLSERGPTGRIALVLGNEGDGLRRLQRDGHDGGGVHHSRGARRRRAAPCAGGRPSPVCVAVSVGGPRRWDRAVPATPAGLSFLSNGPAPSRPGWSLVRARVAGENSLNFRCRSAVWRSPVQKYETCFAWVHAD